ncbi:MAG: metal-dependent hydrolase [Calothrix sp. MO_167.B12]|nr:metal-dependent hydrolase [Calothrix sp. MO_167.B12]
MPSPIAHSVSGYILGKILPWEYTKVSRHEKLYLQLYTIFVAIFADFDFIPQLLTGEKFHRGLTHSIFFSFIFSSIVAFFISNRWNKSYKQIFIFTFIIYCSHLSLDFFTAGGKGMQLFLPFTNSFFKSPIPIFPPVKHSSGLWELSHIITLSFELIYSALLVLGLSYWQRFKTHHKTRL